jgi:hypothetical protein
MSPAAKRVGFTSLQFSGKGAFDTRWVTVDNTDVPRVMRLDWVIHEGLDDVFYAVTAPPALYNDTDEPVRMECYLLQAVNVIHLNGDTLDNRRANLAEAEDWEP